MKKSELKELIRQVVKEEQDYQQLFKHMLDKSGKDISSMSDDEKKKFFNAVDTAYKAKSEGRLRGYNEAELTVGQKKIDVDGDGEIEGSDLAALRDKNETIQKELTFRTGKAAQTYRSKHKLRPGTKVSIHGIPMPNGQKKK
jgi:hypothetical protein